MIRPTALAMLALLAPAMVRAQESQPADTAAGPAGVMDSTSRVNGVPARQLTAANIDTLPPVFQPGRSPALAILFSAIIPGAGQAYSGSYWKVPVIFGFGVYFASEWLSNNRNYIDYRNRYRSSPHTDPVADGLLITNRDFYRDQRDTFTWYFLILYVINIADAYVDASLYDFNVGPDLSLRVMPAQNSFGGPAVGIRIGF